MKETVKKISMTLIAALYLLAAGVTGCYMPDFKSGTVKSGKDVYFAKSEYKSSLHTASESRLTEASDGNKTLSPVFGIICNYSIDYFTPSTYAQYVLRSENFLVRFSKADIIYPFHYFW